MRHILVIVLAAMVALTSCVHEWPEGSGVDPTIIDVAIRLLPSDTLSLYPNGNEFVKTATPENDLAARYYIQLYSSTSENFQIENAKLVWADTLLRDPGEINDPVELNLQLNALHYRMVVWQDFVAKENPDIDKYWHVPSMTDVSAPSKEEYFGCDDNKSAQAVTYEFDLTSHYSEWFVKESIDIPLYKPISKFVIVADDVAEFIKSYKANYNVGPDVSVKDIVDSCSFRVSYVGYMLLGYNVFRDKLNDSDGGYGFDAKPIVLNNGQAAICFDYMLTGPETKVTLKIDTYDKRGYRINSSSNIEVSLARGQVTVVKGNYLTKDYGGGIGIDPGFDGEYNIQI